MGNYFTPRHQNAQAIVLPLKSSPQNQEVESSLDSDCSTKPLCLTENHDCHRNLSTLRDDEIPRETSGEGSRSRPYSESDPTPPVLTWRAVLGLFTVLDCVLICLLVKVSVELAHLHSSAPDPEKNASGPELLEDSPFCLPCSHVYLTQLEVLQNLSKVSMREDGQGKELCCAEAHDDLRKLVGSMFIRVYYERDRATGEVTFTNDTDTGDDEPDVINSHVLLKLDTEKEPQEANGTYTLPLKLTKRAAAAENVSSSVDFLDGRVRVVHLGHYYIHSHIPFAFSSPPAELTQYVHRVRNGGEVLLLENSVFPCNVSMPSGEHSFVGGVFLLERGDEVVLRVSSYPSVEKQKGVEFGVHRL